MLKTTISCIKILAVVLVLGLFVPGLCPPSFAQRATVEKRRHEGVDGVLDRLDPETRQRILEGELGTEAPQLPEPDRSLAEQYPGDQVVVATVENNYTLTRAELDRMAGVSERPGELDPSDEIAARNWERQRDRKLRETMREWTVSKVLVVVARKKGFDVSQDEVDAGIKELRENTGEEDLMQQLRERADLVGITQQQFEGEISEALLVEKYLRHEVEEQITEEQMRDIYDRRPVEFMQPPAWRVQQIFRSIDPAMGTEEKKDIREEFYDLRKKAARKDGRDFDELARTKSDHPLADKAGDMGWINSPIGINEDLLEAVKRTDVGEVSRIVETPAGYHILRVTDYRPASGTKWGPVARERVITFLMNDFRMRVGPELSRLEDVSVSRNLGGLRLLHDSRQSTQY